MTRINYNGSRWTGQDPDTLEGLIAVLAREPLDPTFEEYGNFAMPLDDPQRYEAPAGSLRFWGNFHALSHAFSIDTDDPAVIDRLITAITANQATAAYQQAKAEIAENTRIMLEAAAKRRADAARWRRRYARG